MAPAAGFGHGPVVDAVKKGEGEKGTEVVPAKKPASSESKALNSGQIAKLENTLKQDQGLRVKVKAAQDRLNNDVREVSKELGFLDEQLKIKDQLFAKIAKSGKGEKTEELDRVNKDIKELKQQQELAKEQLDLTVKERKIVGDRLTAIDQKILQNQSVLEQLLSGEGGPTVEEAKTADAKAKSDPRLKKARDEAKARESSAKEAESESKSVQQRVQTLTQFLDLDKELVATDKKKQEITQLKILALEEELRRKVREGAPVEEQDTLRNQITDLNIRLEDIRDGVDERSKRLERLKVELTVLQKEKDLLDEETVKKKAEAETATSKLKELENPFTLRNITRWAGQHAPKIGLILLAMFGVRFLVYSLEKRIIVFMTARSQEGSDEERENRARTLVSVFHNFAMLSALGGGGLMILEEIGIPVVPLMGGAAILGLAVAFGAQNLIKDYFYGFVILLENQYTVNDVVRIGTISGQVERISLRMTVLRDLEGIVHFIPHGQLTSVSNMTQHWSRAVFNIGVAYKENADYVMDVLVKIGRELRRDPMFSDLILEDPDMLGVNDFVDSAVVIKFFIKTRPLQQWKVKREMLRRIKKKFDELGVEIPFPHRTVFHHYPAQEEAGDVRSERAA